MISRRLVRIKTLQALYAWKQSNSDNLEQALRAHSTSLQSTYDVYLHLLEFPAAFKAWLLEEQNREKKKYYPDKNVIRDFGMLSTCTLADSLQTLAYNAKRFYFKENWNTLEPVFKEVFKDVLQEDFVKDYMLFDTPVFGQQQLFLDSFYQYLFNQSEYFNTVMEEQYPRWSDDESVLIREIQKTISQAKSETAISLSPRDDIKGEDMEFAMRLFESVAVNDKIYEDKISGITDNWDPSRIAVIDLIAIKMALAEFLRFSHIPLKVTINEYLEIIKNYSTPNSSRFLNGILDKLKKKLSDTGEIKKAGRGLRDN